MFAVDEASGWQFHFGSKCYSLWLNICCFIYYLRGTGEVELIWVLQMGISSICGDCLSMDPEARGTTGSLLPASVNTLSSLFSVMTATSEIGQGTGEPGLSLLCTKVPWLAQASHSLHLSKAEEKRSPRQPKGPARLGRSQERGVSSLTPPLKLIN